MYILDTDHLSVLDRGGMASRRLFQRLANVTSEQVVTSIISYEEQMRGWLSFVANAQTVDQQVKAYSRLRKHLTNYCAIPVLEFDYAAAQEFSRLRLLYPRLGTMDLKIAAVALVNQSIVLTRNTRDFEKIADLTIDDWT
ncbi:MAG: type II toxin-antitoxin system VapC family toxin [Cyanobacteria bacterium J06614_10]